MDPIEQFKAEVDANVARLGASKRMRSLGLDFVRRTAPFKYSYNFSWMGRPIIQYPQDMVAMQEIIWEVQPDLVIETGIAHGGSLIYYASLLQLIGKGRVLGIDVEIRPHNRKAIEAHPLAGRIDMIEGSSVAPEVVDAVRARVEGKRSVLVALDSNHTHEHVLRELQLYTPLVTMGSFCVVFDTIVEDMPPGSYPDRPWDVGDNPKTAVHEFLKQADDFEIVGEIQHKLLITTAPDGYLRRIKPVRSR